MDFNRYLRGFLCSVAIVCTNEIAQADNTADKDTLVKMVIASVERNDAHLQTMRVSIRWTHEGKAGFTFSDPKNNGNTILPSGPSTYVLKYLLDQDVCRFDRYDANGALVLSCSNMGNRWISYVPDGPMATITALESPPQTRSLHPMRIGFDSIHDSTKPFPSCLSDWKIINADMRSEPSGVSVIIWSTWRGGDIQLTCSSNYNLLPTCLTYSNPHLNRSIVFEYQELVGRPSRYFMKRIRDNSINTGDENASINSYEVESAEVVEAIDREDFEVRVLEGTVILDTVNGSRSIFGRSGSTIQGNRESILPNESATLCSSIVLLVNMVITAIVAACLVMRTQMCRGVFGRKGRLS